MPILTRDTAITALETLVAGAYSWKTGPVRRLKLWNDVSLSARPACFLFEGGEDVYMWTENARPKRIMEIRLFVYLNAKDPSAIGATLLDNVLDALDVAFVPTGSDDLIGRNTLGGVAYQCRIEGKVLKDPGDLDGDAMLVVPIRIVLP
jgi:hypothetical protein